MTDHPERLGNLLGELSNAFGLASPAAVGKVWAEWRGIVGPGIAAHADPTSLRAGVLRIRADSPAWATELGYLGGEIKSRVNRAVGSELVREVRVWIGPRRAPKKERAAVTEQSSPSEPKPAAEDPQEAFERARRAWSKRVGDPSPRHPRETSENQEKPR